MKSAPCLFHLLLLGPHYSDNEKNLNPKYFMLVSVSTTKLGEGAKQKLHIKSLTQTTPSWHIKLPYKTSGKYLR